MSESCEFTLLIVGLFYSFKGGVSFYFWHEFCLELVGSLWGLHFSPFVVVQSLSCVWLLTTLWTAPHQASLPFTISWSWLKLMFTGSVMPSNHLIFHHPLLLSIFPSFRVFSSESVLCIRWPKYWSLSFSVSLSNEYSVLVFFRTDWFDLLAAQGTLKSISPVPQFKSINSL